MLLDMIRFHFFFFAVLKLELKASSMLNNCFTSEQHPQIKFLCECYHPWAM
jgi:hypothetical protein